MSTLWVDFPNHALSFCLRADESLAPLAGVTLARLDELECSAYHAKRDGQVLFFYVDALAGCPVEHPRTRGSIGEIFVFPGDPTGSGRERAAQLLIVYGPDNLFVEPFDRGFKERSYGLVGRTDQPDHLRILGDSIWRRGIEKVRIRRK